MANHLMNLDQKCVVFDFRYADLDGSNRHIIANELPHPFGVAIFGEWAYWTDWNIKSVLKANKFTGDNMTAVYHSTHRPSFISVIHPLKQPKGKCPLIFLLFPLFTYLLEVRTFT